MSILIRDETANATVLTIDNNGNMAFGDGTPISLLSIGGQGIIDDNGMIQHGLTSCSPNPVSGTVNVGYNQSATIVTLAGHIPIVALDTQYPAISYSTGDIGQLVAGPIYGQVVHICQPDVGQFSIKNQNMASEDVQSNINNEAVLNNAPCGYRWL